MKKPDLLTMSHKELNHLEVLLEQVSARYSDFGPTLAAEKLAGLDGIHVSKETLRRWMIAGGLWVPRASVTGFNNLERAVIASESLFTTVLKIAARDARCWCSSTTRRVA